MNPDIRKKLDSTYKGVARGLLTIEEAVQRFEEMLYIGEITKEQCEEECRIIKTHSIVS